MPKMRKDQPRSFRVVLRLPHPASPAEGRPSKGKKVALTAAYLLGAFLLGAALSSCVLSQPATAHSDSHDPQLDAWYNGLKVPPGMGYSETASCCDQQDCKPVQAELRIQGGTTSWWAYVDSKTFPDDGSEFHGHAPNAWVRIPEEAILKQHDNPTGEAVLCWYYGQVRCFVPPNLT